MTMVMTERERIERFELAYNRIDHALDEIVNRDGERNRRPFAMKVRMAVNRFRRFGQYKDFLLEIGDLRNALVHNRTGDDLYLAVPAEKTVEELERIERMMFSPEPVTPRFQREVITLSLTDSLGEVLRLMREHQHSRYPIYDNHGFVGLLTSNGIARWVADHTEGDSLHVDAAKVQVASLLPRDHRRESVEFVARNALIDDVARLFSEKHPMEAAIITEHGRRSERPLGLICAGDIAGMG